MEMRVIDKSVKRSKAQSLKFYNEELIKRSVYKSYCFAMYVYPTEHSGYSGKPGMNSTANHYQRLATTCMYIQAAAVIIGRVEINSSMPTIAMSSHRKQEYNIIKREEYRTVKMSDSNVVWHGIRVT